MRRRLLFIVLSFIVCSAVTAQSHLENAIKVQNLVTPTSSINYNTVDSTDFTIRIRNQGPNRLIAGDQFKVSYSISDGTIQGSDDFDTLILVGGSTMEVNELRQYVLVKDFKLNGNNIFAACADVAGGTVLFPENTNKRSGACATFTVGIDENDINIEKLYYADNTIHFTVTNPIQLSVEVYDITGKVLLNRKLKSQKTQAIKLNSPSKGFYFLKLINKNGLNSVSKFVVN